MGRRFDYRLGRQVPLMITLAFRFTYEDDYSDNEFTVI
jgi:hypothetical protein